MTWHLGGPIKGLPESTRTLQYYSIEEFKGGPQYAEKHKPFGLPKCFLTVLAKITHDTGRCSIVINVNNLKNGRKPVKLQKESPAGCAGEDKQSKGN